MAASELSRFPFSNKTTFPTLTFHCYIIVEMVPAPQPLRSIKEEWPQLHEAPAWPKLWNKWVGVCATLSAH